MNNIYVAQTVLMQMLRNSHAIKVTLHASEKSNFKFTAAFVIDGAGVFILTADSCKPRLVKGSADIESIIRRACAKLQTLSIEWADASRFSRSQKSADADAAQAVARVQALLAGAQARKEKAEAVVIKINAEWAAGEHKTLRLADLAHEIAAADSIINLANDGVLPSGEVITIPDPVPVPDPEPVPDPTPDPVPVFVEANAPADPVPPFVPYSVANIADDLLHAPYSGAAFSEMETAYRLNEAVPDYPRMTRRLFSWMYKYNMALIGDDGVWTVDASAQLTGMVASGDCVLVGGKYDVTSRNYVYLPTEPPLDMVEAVPPLPPIWKSQVTQAWALWQQAEQKEFSPLMEQSLFNSMFNAGQMDIARDARTAAVIGVGQGWDENTQQPALNLLIASGAVVLDSATGFYKLA